MGRAVVVAAQVEKAVSEIECQLVVRAHAIFRGVPPGRFGADYDFTPEQLSRSAAAIK